MIIDFRSDLIQKLQRKCDVIKRKSGEGNKLFESSEFDDEEGTDSNLESDSFGGSAVSKIAQYLAFGSMDLNDFEKLIVNFEVQLNFAILLQTFANIK